MTLMRHDPYSASDRFPQGALPAGGSARLRLRVHGDSEGAYARLWRGGGEEWIKMRPIPGGYEADISAGRAPGLLWYYFAIDTLAGRVYAGKPEGERCAQYDHEPPSFQITVYDPAFYAPKWMRDSVMMQIMVDRFSIGGQARQPHGRGAYLHSDWYEPPHLRLSDPDNDLEAIDFFGGNLKGVEQKLDYISRLGVGAIYLNPIFRARSNHKYDVGDYLQIDPSFGDERDFESLARAAEERGIKLILDGVYSHTGADSRYFNKFGTYDELGAYQSENSRYAPWYSFGNTRDEYDSWWGISTLPNVNELDPDFLNFTVLADDSVVSRYLRAGANGWRLDVADELPMAFLRALRARVKREGAENAVIGEVWDDVTNKIAYGKQRSYALGDTLDSAMNYPLRDCVLNFLLGRTNAYRLAELINHQSGTLPKPMRYSMMNLLGSHDKPRAISALSGAGNLEPKREERRHAPLSPDAYAIGRARFLRAWEFICHLPGMPCLYYGDEAGMTGMGDPFCRAAYPWGREDKQLIEAVSMIHARRNRSLALRRGEMEITAKSADEIELRRYIRFGRDAFGESAPDEEVVYTLVRR